jgi:mRNA interferase RelE/StbE
VTYRIIISDTARRDLRKLDPSTQERIATNIAALGNNPRPSGVKKLQHREGYHIRVGDYRIIYQINDEVVTVTVIRVGHRREVYR